MTTLAGIVRSFGIEPEPIRQIARRQNVHWRVWAGGERYVLRRFGVWGETPGDVAWEGEAVEALAGAGIAVPRWIGGPRRIEGRTYALMPWLGGRAMGHPPISDADYERLGGYLADFHAATAHLAAPAQRPMWTSFVEAALPAEGGAERRAMLLAELAKVDAPMARRFGEAAAALDARNLPGIFAGEARRIVHGDFAPWNIRVGGGQMTGLLDFDITHVDVRAADIAMARRGYHDGVVRGYLRRAALSAAEIASLDALWLGSLLHGVWRVLENRLAEGRITTHGFEWNLEQLDKTRPHRG
jgi:Ser/Thr protein kinase RdoA (MazF antagonist)